MDVKWGVLGTARIAKYCTIPGMQKAEGTKLWAIAGRSLSKAEEYKEQFRFERAYEGYDALLDDPEVQAVYIPLPNDIHLKWVRKALEKGKNVLCEKPLAMNADEAREMYQVAKDNNVILMEAYAYLHSPYIASLKKDLDLIGPVDYIDTAFVTQGYKEDFRLHKQFGGGAIYDLGCYCTTLILTLTDASVSYVKADAELSDEGVDVFTGCLLKFDNGVRASFNVGMNLGIDSNSRYDRLFIHGAKGSIRSEVEYNQEGLLRYEVRTGDQTLVREITAPSNYSLEIQDLNEAITTGKKTLITPEFSIKNAELLDEILKKSGYYEA